MNTETVKRPEQDLTDHSDDDDTLVHRFCQCNEKSALCGKTKDDWKDMPDWEPSEMCIVCEHLHLSRVCPKCKAKP